MICVPLSFSSSFSKEKVGLGRPTYLTFFGCDLIYRRTHLPWNVQIWAIADLTGEKIIRSREPSPKPHQNANGHEAPTTQLTGQPQWTQDQWEGKGFNQAVSATVWSLGYIIFGTWFHNWNFVFIFLSPISLMCPEIDAIIDGKRRRKNSATVSHVSCS